MGRRGETGGVKRERTEQRGGQRVERRREDRGRNKKTRAVSMSPRIFAQGTGKVQ